MLTKGTPFDRSGASGIDVNSGVEPRRAIAFYRVHAENCITEFCVANWCGPQTVATYPPWFTVEWFNEYIAHFQGADHHDRKKDDFLVQWDSYEDGDYLVFKAPDQSHAGQPIRWYYDRRLQIGKLADRGPMDKFILGQRTSLVVQGLKAQAL